MTPVVGKQQLEKRQALWFNSSAKMYRTGGKHFMTTFILGLELSELFNKEAVKPILESGFPEVSYCAALIGGDSQVLGFETLQSSDHHWGSETSAVLA